MRSLSAAIAAAVASRSADQSPLRYAAATDAETPADEDKQAILDKANATIQPSQGDGWKITTPHGYVDFRHDAASGVNEIWWIESHKPGRGHGKRLVDLMQQLYPASTIAWGVTTGDGKNLRDSWHAKNPDVEQQNGAFDGQFDPSGNNYGEEKNDEDFDDEDDFEDDDYLDEDDD